MPIYEYTCTACGHEFEEIVLGDRQPACPGCASAEVSRRLSVFAAHGSASSAERSGPAPCGSCGDPRGPGSCQLS